LSFSTYTRGIPFKHVASFSGPRVYNFLFSCYLTFGFFFCSRCFAEEHLPLFPSFVSRIRAVCLFLLRKSFLVGDPSDVIPFSVLTLRAFSPQGFQHFFPGSTSLAPRVRASLCAFFGTTDSLPHPPQILQPLPPSPRPLSFCFACQRFAACSVAAAEITLDPHP